MATSATTAFTIATYNVLDLFPPGPEGGAAAHHEKKLETLAAKIASLGADVLGLEEVGSNAVLEELVRRIPGEPYRVVFGTPDARGIGCALLSRLPLLASAVHTTDELPFPVFVEGDPHPFHGRMPLRRGIVQGTIDVPGVGPVDVFVVHFKSGRPAPKKTPSGEPLDSSDAQSFEAMESAVRSVVMRAAEALFVRRLVDDVFRKNPGARIAVLGDFNDVPHSLGVRVVSGRGATELFDATASIPHDRRHSHVHFGQKRAIDHVLVSARLRGSITAARVHNDDLRDHDALRAAGQGPFHDSDHAPVTVTLQSS